MMRIKSLWMMAVLVAMASSQVLADTFEIPEQVHLRSVECVKRGNGSESSYGYDVYSTTGQYIGASPLKTQLSCERDAIRTNEILGRSPRVSIKVSENSPNVIEEIQQLRAASTATPLIVMNRSLSCEYVKSGPQQILKTGCEKPLVVSQLSCDDNGFKFTTLAACTQNISANDCYGTGNLEASKSTATTGGTR